MFLNLTNLASNLRNKIIKWTASDKILVYLLHVEQSNCLQEAICKFIGIS